MRIIDRYIQNNIFKIFAATLIIFTLLYLMIDVTAQLDEFIDRKVPLGILLKYYLAFTPTIIVQMSSFACLIAVLLTFSGLNNSNEVIAMRASGLNFWQITKPAIIFGLVVSAFALWINEIYVPEATQVTKQIRQENLTLEADRVKRKKEKIKNLTFYGLKNRLYFIDTFDPENSEIQGVTIIEYNQNQNIEQKIISLKGVWTGIAWKFYQCQITSFEGGALNNPIRVKVYNEKLMDIQETPDDFLNQRINVSSMNIKQLNQYIQKFSTSGATRALDSLRVDMHQKIAYPFGSFIIVLVGLPFALMVKNRKGATVATLGIAIVIGFLYYVTNAISLAFGKGGLIPPFFCAWLAPFIFTVIAFTLIKLDFSN